MADTRKPKTDPGYCRGCGRLNPCKATHTKPERERLDLIARQEQYR